MLEALALKTRKKESVVDLFNPFESVSLEKTNEMAQMLSRIDNKYVVNSMQFKKLLSRLNKRYAILEIEDRKQFSYSSCYYDDARYTTYFDHHQGRRNRFKVRTREYVDSKLLFFETKFKGCRGLTNKHRMKAEVLKMQQIKGQYLDLVQKKYKEYFHKECQLDLKPSLIVNYKRCTLVALQGGERVTIDFNLAFKAPKHKSKTVKIGQNFIIVETKSADGKGYADNCLSALKIRQASKCSKYCLGLNLTGAVKKNNRFLSTIRHISQNIVTEFGNDAAHQPTLGVLR
jgi:hypothetical protein